jgi:SAM-dependent methyltransferase
MCDLADLSSIDWYRLWEERMRRSSWAKDGEEWWDKRAEAFDHNMKESGYVDRMLERLAIKPDSTVLDIGCGPGTLAIPLAKRVKAVTALDISQEMLRFVVKNACSEGLSNITCLQQRWEDVVVGRDVKPHDVVICSRAFPERNPKNALLQLNNAARKYVYITMWANGDEFETFYKSVYLAAGKDYHPPPDYIYVYNMLYQEGILANVEFIHYTHYMRYPDIDTAMKDWTWRMRPESDEQTHRLRRHLLERLSKNQGPKLEMALDCRWALIWWRKEKEE